MNEELGTLTVVLKAMGLENTTRGIQELERVLLKTGMSAQELAQRLDVTQTAAAQLGAGNSVLMRLFQDGDATIARYSTRLETLKQNLAAVQQQMTVRTPDGGVPVQLHRAELDLMSQVAVEEGRALSLTAHRTAELEKQNTLKLQASALLRQMETAEEAHERRIATYKELRKAKLIEELDLRRAIQQSEMAMRMQVHGKGGGQGAFQAAYGIQDFATVLAMGGSPGMAILSAQNNLSQMLMVSTKLNPMLVAVAGTMAALTAIGVGIWWDKYVSGAKAAEDSTNKLDEALKRLIASAGRAKADLSTTFRVQDIGDLGSRGAADSARAARRGLDSVFIDEQAARDRQREIARALAASVRTRVGAPMDAESIVQRTLQGMGASGRTSAPSETEIASIRKRAIEAAEEDRARREREYNEQLQAAIRGSKEYTAAQDDLKKAIDERSRLSRELVAAERQIKLAEEREAAERTARKSMAAQGSIESAIRESSRSLAIASGTASSTQFQAQDAIGEFIANLRAAKGIGATEKLSLLDEFAGNQSAMIDKQIADLQKQPRGRDASFQSFSGFGQSLQLALLKPQDEAKVQRQKQIDLLEQAKDELTKIREQAKGNLAVAAP